MKIKHIAIAAVIGAAALTPLIIFNQNSGAQVSSYMDYSAVQPLIDTEFASSRIYYTNNTQLIVKKDGADDTRTGTFSGNYPVQPGKQFVMLISNSSATDNNGNPVDVIWKVNNVKYWDELKDADGNPITDYEKFFSISKRSATCGSSADVPTTPDYDPCNGGDGTNNLGSGDPIMFWLNAHFASGDFTVQYIKKGSFSDSTLSGTPAGLTRLTYLAYDFDVPNDAHYTTADYFNGDEGARVTPASASKTTFYYNKNNTSPSMPEMYESQNGLAVRNLGDAGYSGAYNGIHWGTSYYATVTSMANSSYTFTYAASTAGTTYFFGSPSAYDTPDPVKYVEEDGKTENRATTGSKFNYIIKQRIPNVFSTSNDILTFASLYSKYSSINESHNYTSFKISDNIDANLILPVYTAVKVYRGSTDVTDKFDVVISGRDITVSAKAAYLATADFYNATYKIVIPVTAKNTITTQQIPNHATNSYTYTGITTPRTKTTNDTITNIYHKLTVRHIDKETGKEISDTIATEQNHGSEYTTSKASDLPTGYQLIAVPDNATGIMNSDVTVTYYYNIPKNPSTLDRDLVPFAITLGGTALIAAGLFCVATKRR
ncbi:isopeptide-forming domain-containing fimbrial protein [Candidatus Saccharibacteria bacterium]|nr:isopeptide-forming domain-containing fimbrial protein [Candidatus Saccharibacteria bacterium]